ncbi:MAG: hypothetical protein HUU35_08165 [Armatimonadetes bacterium]|nr:hypothetical protein [Armatimonadota bacterium]
MSDGVTMQEPLDGKERLRLAGLDRDLPVNDTGKDERFCAYTGRPLKLVVPEIGGGTDEAALGRDAFTGHGQIVRYAARGGGHEPVKDPAALGHLRGTVDLYASSGMPLPETAVHQAGGGEAPVDRLQLVARGMGQVSGVVARHGRLYALNTYQAQQHALQAWRLPHGAVAEGWRPPRLQGTLARPAGSLRGSELCCSESLVYINLEEHLAAWHCGTGELRVIWPWPAGPLPTVRIAYDRMLLVREADGAQIAEVYDLGQVASGPCRPLPGQARRLCDLPIEPRPLWAEAAGEQFVVCSADGHVHVFPFDAAPYEAFGNVEGLVLGPPAVRRTETSPELVAFVTKDRGRWLLRLPLDPTQPYRIEELPAEPPASTAQTPCFAAGRLISAHVSTDEILTISRAAAERLTDHDGQVQVPGTAGARLYGLQRAFVAGQEIVCVDYAVATHRWWLGTATLQKLLADPPFPQLKVQNHIRLLWDAGGLYLCDLTDGELYGRSPVA